MATGNDATANLLVGLESKLLSNMAGAVLGSTAGGWVAALVSYGFGTPQTPSISNVLSALGDISTALGDLAQNLQNLDQAIINNDDANNLATAVAYAMDPVKNKDASEFDHNDIIDIRNHSSYLLTIHNTQMGNLPGSAGPFLANWIDKYAPQFYSDSVQLAIIHEQFDYYQQAQLLMTNLLLEAYHFGDPATEDDPPRPPRYGSARTVLNQYAAQVQEQSTWLPFPKPMTNTVPPLPNIFDRDNGVAWLTQNGAVSPGCQSIPTLRSDYGDPTLLALPTIDQLTNLSKNLTSYTTAYDKIRSQAGSTLPASPGCQDYLNAFGFNVKFGNAPVAAAEAIDPKNWTTVSPHGHFSGYECPYFFDVANNRQMTVFVGVNASDANSHDPITNMASATMAQCYPPGSDDATSLDKSAYADVLPIVLYHPADPHVEEPVRIEIQVSEISVTATGIFERVDPSSGKLGECGIDISRYVYWQVSDETVARISNSPDSIGTFTWLKMTGSVTVTAMRHRPASPSKLHPSANPSAGPNTSNSLTLESPGATDTATGINIYPRDTGFTSVTKLPAEGMRIFVQRIHERGDPDDDITNGQCLLKADSSSLQFTDPPNAGDFGLKSGTFNIDETAPPSSTITITAQDGFENGGSDTLTLTIRGAST